MAYFFISMFEFEKFTGNVCNQWQNIFLKVYLGCSFLNTKNQANQITRAEKIHNYEHICRLCSL